MNTSEKTFEEIIPPYLAEIHTTLDTQPDYGWNPSRFRIGYGLGYLPDNFDTLPYKERVRVSHATLYGNQYSVQDLKCFMQLSDEQLPAGVTRADVTLMVQRRLEWQGDVVQMLMQDPPQV